MPKPLRAWLLDWPDQPLALAACEVIEILDAPEIHQTPFGPAWCRAMVVWRDRLLALALPEQSAALGDDADCVRALSIVVVAYQSQAMRPLEYAAIAVQSPPRQIEVQAGNDCEAPTSMPFDVSAVRACFNFEQRTLIVPELSALFGTRVAA